MQASIFRPIYYLGCKASFAPAIQAAIDELDPSRGRVCDLFAGSGVVGAALGATREVTTVDIQEYSRVLSSAQLNPPAIDSAAIDQVVSNIFRGELLADVLRSLDPLINYEQKSIDAAVAGDVKPLLELLESPPLSMDGKYASNSLDSKLTEAKSEVTYRLQQNGLWSSPDTTVSRHFGGVYFSFVQAALLDAILAFAESSADGLRDMLKASALSTASILVNTVGKQFAQPIRPRNKSGTVKTNLARVVQRDRLLNTLDTYSVWLRRYAELPRAQGRSFALRSDYQDALNEYGPTFSVLYADPPYTRDHYSRFYHVLETMCLRDNPTVSRVMKRGKLESSRGLYREDRHQSPFCIRSSAPAAFEALFRTARQYDLPVVLSYSPHETGDGTHPRVVSMSQIFELASAHYSRVDISTIAGVVHNKLNRSDLTLKTREHAEILLRCFR